MSSSAAETHESVQEAPEPLDLASARALAATPGATVAEVRDGRTGPEKVKALDEATEATGNVDSKKTIYELAVGSKAEVAAAIQQIAYVLERSFNIDFVREASLAEVHQGIAAQRAAMSGTNEKPQEVDDRIVPPGVNNASDDLLPPNIPAGEAAPGHDEDADDARAESATGDLPSGFGVAAPEPSGPPNKSDNRDVWDAYARKLDLNPDDYAKKEDLIAAVEKQQGAAGGTNA